MNLPNISQPTKLPRLNVAIEKSRNAAMIHLGIDPQRAAEAIIEDAKAFEPILTAYADKVKAIKADSELSREGKQKRIDKALSEITTQLAKMDQSARIEEGCKTCEAQLINAVKKATDEYRPQDATLAYWQEKEMREYLHRHREEKRREHEAWLAGEKEAGRPVPDQMRTFYDPVEGFYLQACQKYGPDTAQLYRAITNAPYPVQLLPPDIIEKGRHILENRLAPEKVEQLAQARARLDMFKGLYQAVLEIADRPEKLHAYDEPRRLQSDEERRAAA